MIAHVGVFESPWCCRWQPRSRVHREVKLPLAVWLPCTVWSTVEEVFYWVHGGLSAFALKKGHHTSISRSFVEDWNGGCHLSSGFWCSGGRVVQLHRCAGGTLPSMFSSSLTLSNMASGIVAEVLSCYNLYGVVCVVSCTAVLCANVTYTRIACPVLRSTSTYIASISVIVLRRSFRLLVCGW